MLSPAERRRARDFNARVAGRRGTERRYPDRAGHVPQHAARQHVSGAHRAPEDGTDEVTDLVLLTERLGRAGSQVRADDEFRDRLRQRLIAVASVHGINAEPGFNPPPAELPARPRALPDLRRRVPRRVTVISGTLAGLVALSGVGFASGGANPGDALYGVKRSREAAQLTLARSSVARGQLHLDFARNRLAEAAAATTDLRQLTRLFDDMDSDTRLGMADLGTAAVTQHHPAPLDLVNEFTQAQRRELDHLARVTRSTPAVRRIRASVALLDRISVRSATLRGVVRCAPPATSDDLGPIAEECSRPRSEETSLPSSEPAPPPRNWPAPTRRQNSGRSSGSPSASPTGSAAGTGLGSPGAVGRTSPPATDDEWDASPSSSAESMVPQSGTVFPPPFTTGASIGSLVGSGETGFPSDSLDSVVRSALESERPKD
ncbi:DUF5667 domain-containing protein [Cryptosporangium sp. NPDC051539]|uniref:DUF5667 domain-containing protein n=1 Tax=Cryptosporangium sp. NPDC051539 TaxID=3363962 RepID=UPI00378FD62D